jgi:hypothetical protein
MPSDRNLTASHDDLIARAKQRATSSGGDERWGYRIALGPDDSFVGRWRGETTDPANDNRRIFLLWDADGQRCYSRSYAALNREIDEAAPTVGCTIAIVRGPDYTSEKGTGYSFGVTTEPNDEPPPSDDDIPF